MPLRSALLPPVLDEDEVGALAQLVRRIEAEPAHRVGLMQQFSNAVGHVVSELQFLSHGSWGSVEDFVAHWLSPPPLLTDISDDEFVEMIERLQAAADSEVALQFWTAVLETHLDVDSIHALAFQRPALTAREVLMRARARPSTRSQRTFDVVGPHLAEAAAWCLVKGNVADPVSSLRSAALSAMRSDTTEALETSALLVEVAAVIARRQRLLSALPDPDWSSWTEGRVVVYFPDDNLACGASSVTSRGFFDVNNTPPWDSWIGAGVCNGRPFILSFVPAAFVATINRAIHHNPEACIIWLDDADDAITAMALTMLRQPLLVVDDRFQLEQRDLRLTPHLDVPLPKHLRVRLERADGSSTTTMAACHWMSGGTGPGIAIVVPLTKADVPIGTTVWWVPDAA